MTAFLNTSQAPATKKWRVLRACQRDKSVWRALVYTARMSGKMCNKHTYNHPTTIWLLFGSALLKQIPQGILT